MIRLITAKHPWLTLSSYYFRQLHAYNTKADRKLCHTHFPRMRTFCDFLGSFDSFHWSMLYFCHVESHSVVVIFFLFDRGGVGDSLLYQRQDVGGYLF